MYSFSAYTLTPKKCSGYTLGYTLGKELGELPKLPKGKWWAI